MSVNSIGQEFIETSKSSRLGHGYDEWVGVTRAILISMRPHHWIKNLMIFAPIAFLNPVQLSSTASLLIGFVCFCFMASAVYLINDFFDQDHDRLHPLKKFRPLAAGQTSSQTMILTAILLMAVSLGSSLLLPANFSTVLLFYSALNLLYSFALKKFFLLDVIVVSIFHCCRILGAFTILKFFPSPYQMLFFFTSLLSLSFLKRMAELVECRFQDEGLAGRGYANSHESFLTVAGILFAVFSCAFLYVTLNLQDSSQMINIGIVFLTGFWIFRSWWIVCTQKLKSDLVWFVIKDPISYLTLGIVGFLKF